MKKNLKKHVVVCLGFIVALISCNTGNKPEKIASNEEIIDLQAHPKPRAEGDTLRARFRAKILIDSTLSLSDTAEKIDIAAFQTLKDRALKLKGNFSGKYLLGLAITYGLNTSLDTLKVFYKSVFIKKTSADTTKIKAQFEPKLDSIYYRYVKSTKSFEQVNKSIAKTAIQTYTAHITFRNATNSHYRKYRDLNDSTSDIKAVVYPFQEIDSVIVGHQAARIHLYNIGEYVTANHAVYLKHGLLLGSEDFKKIDEPLFYTKYGNLSHLCPPSCSVFTFNLK